MNEETTLVATIASQFYLAPHHCAGNTADDRIAEAVRMARKIVAQAKATEQL